MEDSISKGQLYLCPTPIGNLGDITLRTIDCLASVDLIACEDTRRTQKLLNHLEINGDLISYYKFNQESRGRELLEKLWNGAKIALVSDAGTPSISDPGKFLVQTAIAHDITVISLPGSSAVITALAGSGLETDSFLFLGYLPEKGQKRKDMLVKISTSSDTVVIYENFRRIQRTIADLQPLIGKRQMVIAKELTKVHEDYLRGCSEELLDQINEQELRGECTLLIEGKLQADELEKEEEPWPSSVTEHLKEVISEGFSKKQAIKLVSELREMPKREVYQKALNIEKE